MQQNLSRQAVVTAKLTFHLFYVCVSTCNCYMLLLSSWSDQAWPLLKYHLLITPQHFHIDNVILDGNFLPCSQSSLAISTGWAVHKESISCQGVVKSWSIKKGEPHTSHTYAPSSSPVHATILLVFPYQCPGLLGSVFLSNILCAIIISPMHATCLAYLIFLGLTILIICGEEYRLRNCSSCRLQHAVGLRDGKPFNYINGTWRTT
jgi:hypothetical protein